MKKLGRLLTAKMKLMIEMIMAEALTRHTCHYHRRDRADKICLLKLICIISRRKKLVRLTLISSWFFSKAELVENMRAYISHIYLFTGSERLSFLFQVKAIFFAKFIFYEDKEKVILENKNFCVDHKSQKMASLKIFFIRNIYIFFVTVMMLFFKWPLKQGHKMFFLCLTKIK